MFLKIIFSVFLLFIFTGCVERYISRGSIINNNTDWKARSGGGRSGTSKDTTELINFEKEAIIITLEPYNYLESMQKKNDYFVIAGSIAIYYEDEKELSYVPKVALLNIDKNILHPIKVTLSDKIIPYDDFNVIQWKAPNNMVIKGKGKFNKYTKTYYYKVRFSLLFAIKPPSVEKSFALDLGSIYIDEKEIKIPTVIFKKGIHFVGFLM